VTAAIRLRRQFTHQHLEERAAEHWRRIYPEVIPNDTTMTEIEQADARQELRERVRW
jgi:hypothetical protein